jgi:hypothetical protein
MNDTTIEKLLFQAPKPVASADLLREIQADIALPSAKPTAKMRDWQNPLRRWFPAMAFGVLMLSCAIMIAVQANWGTNLKIQNDVLRATTADLPKLRAQHAALENAQANQDEVVRLRKDNEELHRLQAEVAQLRNLPAQIEQLQNENKRLAAAPAADPNAANSASFFADAQAEAERTQCVNNLKQIGLALRVWSTVHDDKYPTSLMVMSNELSTPKILICPGDTARQPYTSLGFGQFQDSMTSYQFTMKPDDGNFPYCIIATCPIHHNYLLSDGSVQRIDPKTVYITQKDGRFYLEQAKPGATYRDAIIQTIK